MAEAYTRAIAIMAESVVTITKMANNMMVANMESMRTTMDSARDNVRDMTRLASTNATVRGRGRQGNNKSFFNLIRYSKDRFDR